MNGLNFITLILIIIGGLNWLAVGLTQTDLVSALFGIGSPLTRLIFVLVGLSAIWQIIQLLSAPTYPRDGTPRV